MPAIKIMVGNITVIMSIDLPNKLMVPSVQKIESNTIEIGTITP